MTAYVASTSTDYANVFRHNPEVVARNLANASAGYVRWKILGSTTAGKTLTAKITSAIGTTFATLSTDGLDDIQWSSETINQLVYTEDLSTTTGNRAGIDHSISIAIKSSDGSEVRLYGIVITEQQALAFSIDEIVTGLNDPRGICVHDGTLFFAEYSESSAGKIQSVSNSGGTPADVITGLNKTQTIGTNGTYLVFNNFSTADGGTYYCRRTAMDGSGGTNLATHYWGPYSVDADDTYAYWYSWYGAGAINRVPLSGGSSTGIAIPDVLIVDLCIDDNYVYWMDNAAQHYAWLKSKSGGGSNTKINPTYISGTISDITVDENYLYYGLSTGAIYRMALSDGTITEICTISGCVPRGFCNDDTYLYLTDSGNGSIWRITKIFE